MEGWIPTLLPSSFRRLGRPRASTFCGSSRRIPAARSSHGLPAGDIGRALGIPPATLSFHLKEMTYKGLLSQSRFGRSVYYRADIEALLDTLDYLVSEVCGS